MAEVFATISAAAALAAESIKLSKTIYVFVNEVKDTGTEAKGIADEIQATSTLLDQFGTNLRREEQTKLCNPGFYDSTKQCVDSCERVFGELRTTITKAVPGISFNTSNPEAFVTRKRDQLKWPFSRTDVNRHSKQLQKVKADLQLMVMLMIEAHHLYDRQEAAERRQREQKLERKRRAIEKQLLSNDMNRLMLQAQMAGYALQSDSIDLTPASPVATVVPQTTPLDQPVLAVSAPAPLGPTEAQRPAEGVTNLPREPPRPTVTNDAETAPVMDPGQSPSLQEEAPPPPFEAVQYANQASPAQSVAVVEETAPLESSNAHDGSDVNDANNADDTNDAEDADGAPPSNNESTAPMTAPVAPPPIQAADSKEPIPPRSKRSMLRSLWRRKAGSNNATLGNTTADDTDMEYQAWSWKIEADSADGNRLPLPHAEMAQLAHDFARKGKRVNGEYARLQPWLFRVIMRQLDRINTVASEPWAVAAMAILPKRARMVDVRDVRVVLSRRRPRQDVGPGDEDKFLFLNTAPGQVCKVPWRIARSYERVHELLRRIYRSSPGFHAIDELRYGIITPDNEILLPELWSDVIQPGWTVVPIVAADNDRLDFERGARILQREEQHNANRRHGRNPSRERDPQLIQARRRRSRSRSRSPPRGARDERRNRRPPAPPRVYPDRRDDDGYDDGWDDYYSRSPPAAARARPPRPPPDYDGYYAPNVRPMGAYDERVYRAEVDYDLQRRRDQEFAFERSRREHEERLSEMRRSEEVAIKKRTMEREKQERERKVEEDLELEKKKRMIERERARKEAEEEKLRKEEFEKAAREEAERNAKKKHEYRARLESQRRAEADEGLGSTRRRQNREETDPLASLLRKYTVLELTEERRTQPEEDGGEDSDASEEATSEPEMLVRIRGGD